MWLKVKYESDQIKRLKLSDGNSGIDLYTMGDPILLPPRKVVPVPLGIYLEIADGYEGQLRPRSGWAVNKNIVVILGTIDSSYRGQVSAMVLNLSQYRYVLRPFSKIAQLVIQKVPEVEIFEVDELIPSNRGDNGFGSSGY
jgi:dUTP pyrophosphatase